MWCRAHYCRFRVAGCGDRACLRHAAGMPRACRGPVSFGLLTRASSGWRRVMGMADHGVVWAEGGSLQLLTRASSGRRRVIGTGSTGASTGGSRRSGERNGSFLKAGLYRIVIFGLWYRSGLWGGPKRLLYKGRSSAESSFLSFGTGHCVSGHVTARNITSCRVMSRHAMSCHVMSCHVMSCHVMSCHVASCHVMSFRVMSWHVLSCHVMSCHIMSCHVMAWQVL